MYILIKHFKNVVSSYCVKCIDVNVKSTPLYSSQRSPNLKIVLTGLMRSPGSYLPVQSCMCSSVHIGQSSSQIDIPDHCSGLKNLIVLNYHSQCQKRLLQQLKLRGERGKCFREEDGSLIRRTFH